MKKNLIFTLLLVLALGLALAACSSGDDDTGAPVEEPLVFTKTMNGKTVVVMITRNNPAKDAITPKQGDYYVIYLDGKIISYGRITTMTEGGKMTFTPDSGSPGSKVAFEGTLDNNGSLYIAEIPYEGGNISGFSAVESNRADSSGGTGGTGGGGGGGGASGGGTVGGGVLNPFNPIQPNAPILSNYSLTVSTPSMPAGNLSSSPNLPVSLALAPAVSPSIQMKAADVTSGRYTYTARLLDVDIGEGIAVADGGGPIVFTPEGGGPPISYDGANITGTLTLTPQMQADIENAAGLGIIVPATIDLSGHIKDEASPSGNIGCDGTWVMTQIDGDPTPQEIVFSGSNYTITKMDGTPGESGTFFYCNPDNGDHDRLFIFSRTGGPFGVYLWEGVLDEPNPEDNWLILYNWINDDLEITIDPYWAPPPGSWAGQPAVPIGPSDPGWDPVTFPQQQIDRDDYLAAMQKMPEKFVKQP